MLTNVGERLKEERERLGLSQESFGKTTGLEKISKQVQSAYERNKTNPDNEYWAAVDRIGVDIRYVLTGLRTVGGERALPYDVLFINARTGKPVTAKEFREIIETIKAQLNHAQHEISQIQEVFISKPD